MGHDRFSIYVFLLGHVSWELGWVAGQNVCDPLFSPGVGDDFRSK